MTLSAWLNTDHQLEPGAEIFHAERCFQLWSHTASHSQTLLRSPKGQDRLGRTLDTRIDVLFKPVTAMKVRQNYDDLVIRCATNREAERILEQSPDAHTHRDERVFFLESAGETDYVIASAVGWHEDTLAFEEPSHFTGHDPDTPDWARKPLFGVDGGLGGNAATPQDLIEALLGDVPEEVDRDRYRSVYVLMMRLDAGVVEPRIFPAGVFLTDGEAEKARIRLSPRASRCWIETVPIAV